MKHKLLISRIVLFLILAIVFTGCTGGGGSGDDSAPESLDLPSVQVLPSDYDSGIEEPNSNRAPAGQATTSLSISPRSKISSTVRREWCARKQFAVAATHIWDMFSMMVPSQQACGIA